jgi:hypothetical protein
MHVLVRRCALLLAATIATTASGLVAARAESTAPVTLLTTTPIVTSYGPVHVEVGVDLGGATSATVGFQLGSVTEQSVLKADCPTTCTLSFDVDPGSFELAVPGGEHSTFVNYRDDTGLQTYVYGPQVTWDVPLVEAATSPQTLVAATANTPTWGPDVPDTAFTAVVTTQTADRPTGEVVESRLFRANSSGTVTSDTAVRTTSAPWNAGRASVVHDTTTLPEGSYRAVHRVRSPEGRYTAAGESVVHVRHRPGIRLYATPPATALRRPTGTAGALLLLPEADPSVFLVVEGPQPYHDRFESARVTVDGVTSMVQTSQYGAGAPPLLTGATRYVSAQLPSAATALGEHVITTELNRYDGTTTPPITYTQRVGEFQSSVAAPTRLFVGRAASLGWTARSPLAETFTSCAMHFSPTGSYAGPSYSGLCPVGSTTLSRSLAFTPSAAGSVDVTTALSSTHDLFHQLTQTHRIYAARKGSLTATSTAYGGTSRATVALTDLTTVGAAAKAAPAGVAVTLQVRRAGATTWSNIATTKTVTGGKASFSWTSRYNGTLRAIYPSTAPGLTEASNQVSVAVPATVAITAAPTSAYAGRTFSVTASTKAWVATGYSYVAYRRVGATKWTALPTAAIRSTGYVTMSARIPYRGSYQIVVVRKSTTLNSAGKSAVRSISIR